MYRRGTWAFDDVTDKGARKRAESMALPPTRKKCRDGTHLYSVWVREFFINGVEYDTVRCPDCGDEHTAPSLASVRRERGMDW